VTTHSVSPITGTTLTVAERRPIVIDYWTRGYNAAQMARAIGCSPRTVSFDLKELGLPGAKTGRPRRIVGGDR
jgi:DNA-binding CsgD family transcriptional regulator